MYFDCVCFFLFQLPNQQWEDTVCRAGSVLQAMTHHCWIECLLAAHCPAVGCQLRAKFFESLPKGTISYSRKHEYHYTLVIEFDESFQSYLSSSVLLMLNTLVLSTYLDVRARLSISDLRLPSDRRTILIGKLPHLAMISSPRGVSI